MTFKVIIIINYKKLNKLQPFNHLNITISVTLF